MSITDIRNTGKRPSFGIAINIATVAIKPNALDIPNNKGVVLTKLGKYGEATKVFDKISSLDRNTHAAGDYTTGTYIQ